MTVGELRRLNYGAPYNEKVHRLRCVNCECLYSGDLARFRNAADHGDMTCPNCGIELHYSPSLKEHSPPLPLPVYTPYTFEGR